MRERDIFLCRFFSNCGSPRVVVTMRLDLDINTKYMFTIILCATSLGQRMRRPLLAMCGQYMERVCSSHIGASRSDDTYESERARLATKRPVENGEVYRRAGQVRSRWVKSNDRFDYGRVNGRSNNKH